MFYYDDEAWRSTCEAIISKHCKYIDTFDFYVETLDLYDRNGNEYQQMVPKFRVSFK